MKKLLHRLFHEEEGQSLVLITFMLVLLLGFSALVIDLSIVQIEKTKLQNAADAAALAGAQDLPNSSLAFSTALEYARLNGMASTAANIEQDGDLFEVKLHGAENRAIEVTATRTTPSTFARILGFEESLIKARAIAYRNPIWAGEALPFVNLDDDYRSNPSIEAWEKTNPGDFESIWKDDYHIYNASTPAKTFFKIFFEDGITIQKGVDASIKTEVAYVFNQQLAVPGKHYYMFSLSSEVIRSGKYDAKNYIDNKDVIPLADLVLLEVTFDDYEFKGGNSASLNLTYKKEYPLDGELPTDFLLDESEGDVRLIG